MAPQPYDVFISYKSDYKPWVETLARNLTAQGLSVWFDDWRKVAGDRVTVTLEVGIQQARAGILIVTPEAAESGWVQKEYDTMVSEENRERPDGSRFRVIPVLLRPTGGFPFLQTRFVVDFRDPADYERRLVELVRGLRGLPAPPDARLDAAFELPPPVLEPASVAKARVRSVFDRMFVDLDHFGIVALFAQEAMGFGGTDVLLQQARERYTGGTVLHLVPLVCTDDEAEGYFADLGEQLGLGGGLTNRGAIAPKLPGLVRRGRRLVIVLSEFENGPTKARHDFSTMLRNFFAAHREEVRIVVRGGEELARLKYEDGEISLLGLAATCYWPELTTADITQLYGLRNPGRALRESVAAAVLDLTGGEPRMVGHCIRWLGDLTEEPLPTDALLLRALVEDLLADCDLGPQLFVPLRKEPAVILRQLCTLLSRADLGPFSGPHLDNPLVRRLFWRNAICIRQSGFRRTLAWRSDHLRRLGREILQCDG